MKLQVDMSQWTYGDAMDLEEAGFSVGDLQRLMTPRNGDRPEIPIRLAVVLIWLFRRKTEPSFTFEDAKAMPMTDELEVELVDLTRPKAGSTSSDSLGSVSEPAGPLTR